MDEEFEFTVDLGDQRGRGGYRYNVMAADEEQAEIIAQEETGLFVWGVWLNDEKGEEIWKK